MGARKRRLLTVGHSYVVRLNRRLANEMARAGRARWEVTAVAPRVVRGDLRKIALEIDPDEQVSLVPVRARLTRPVHLMAYGRELRETLRGNWSLVHSWEEPYVLAGHQLARWTPRSAPLVFWTAQNISKRYPPPFGWFERRSLHRCAGWLACGETVVQTLVPRGYGVRPHRVMPLGVDLERFRPEAAARAASLGALGWDDGSAPVVGYLGRFVTEKGVRLLVRVLEALAGRWRALFVGGGPLEGELRKWAAGRPERVRVVTGVPHEEVPRYLAAMDVLCAPSQTTPRWREQLGRMVIEAFASGVPVIASDSGELPYVVAEAGVLVPEAAQEAWRDALEGLLDSPRRRAELAAAGLERAGAEYAWPTIARRHLGFFEELLDGA